jgi:hypothetical protein
MHRKTRLIFNSKSEDNKTAPADLIVSYDGKDDEKWSLVFIPGSGKLLAIQTFSVKQGLVGWKENHKIESVLDLAGTKLVIDLAIYSFLDQDEFLGIVTKAPPQVSIDFNTCLMTMTNLHLIAFSNRLLWETTFPARTNFTTSGAFR